LHGRTHHSRQRDGVDVELLCKPDLPHADVECAAGLFHDVVDAVGGRRAGGDHYSGRHTHTNPGSRGGRPQKSG